MIVEGRKKNLIQPINQLGRKKRPTNGELNLMHACQPTKVRLTVKPTNGQCMHASMVSNLAVRVP